MILQVRGLKKSFRHPWTLKKLEILEPSSSLKVKNQMGYLPERPYFYRYLSAEEFLSFYGRMSGLPKSVELKKRIDELLEMVGLVHAKKLLLKNFSKGMLQRVGLAQALIHKPDFLILDEPLSGLDPDGRMQIAKAIEHAVADGATVFFSSHLLDDVDRLCQSLVVIRNGIIAYSGDKNTFAKSEGQTYDVRALKGDQLVVKNCADLASVQKTIDNLRAKDLTIVGVEAQIRPLEEAYKAFHDKGLL